MSFVRNSLFNKILTGAICVSALTALAAMVSPSSQPQTAHVKPPLPLASAAAVR